MRYRFTLGFISLLILFIHFSPSFGQELKQSIVKVNVVSNTFNYAEPWQKYGTSSSTGSGCIISSNRILTNAHVVANHTFVQVQLPGEAKKYTAQVVAIGDICDLALLKVSDNTFLKKIKPLEIGELPLILDEIQVYGFPIGGQEMSITKGVVSRIEHDKYAQSGASLLACQIDAAVNPGNSGGPVIKDGKVVGIVMQSLGEAQNTNFFIPPNIVKHFLKDIEDGKFQGFPSLMVRTQIMENPDIRNYYKMNDSQTGTLIKYILPDSPVKGILQINDIIMSIDSVNIDDDRKAEFRKGERTDYEYLIQEKFVGDRITLKILRDGIEKEVQITLTGTMDEDELVPFLEYNKQPTYYIIGGFVFQSLTKNYIEEMWEDGLYSGPPNLNNVFFESKNDTLSEVVILNKVLADEINVGYQEVIGYDIIKNVNGNNISSMKGLVKSFEENTSDYHIITNEWGNKFILDRKKVIERNNAILEKYGISADRSENLKIKK